MLDITPDWLARLPPLADVPPAQLAWFAANATHHLLAPGEALFTAGEAVLNTHLVVSGRLEVAVPQGAERRVTATLQAGDLTGYLPFSRMKAATATSRALESTQVMTFPAGRTREMIRDHFELAEALVHVMISRVRDFTALQQQNEKMMALGKLSAGLAHELNNPASAVARDAQTLQKHLSLLPESFKDVMNIRMTPDQVDAVGEVLFRLLRAPRPQLSLLQRSDREDELLDWFDARAVADPAELAEHFTDFGFCVADLDEFAPHIPAADLRPVLQWVSNNILTDRMVGDIGEAAGRIAALVQSIKAFTHMDRGSEKQAADIHDGIRNTLTMLGHKLRAGAVRLEEAYDLTLPPVTAMIGELNQVWTNLLDNALDAMAGRAGSVLHIATVRDGPLVCVTITDNGPGIPADVRPRIFDPFFTTKPIGKGTGLGLEVVQRIVQQHGGRVGLESAPGRTAFTVCFPIGGG